MKLSQIVKQCCIRVGDPVPSNILSDEDSSKEWFGYISQACQQIVREHNWQRLCKRTTFTTTDGTTSYDLPDDFESLVTYWLYNKSKKEQINSADDDTFNALDDSDDVAFQILGGKIELSKPIDAGNVIQYQYKINSVCKYDDGVTVTYKDSFTNEDDEFLLDAELLILKAIALRSQNLEFADYQTRLADYEKYLEAKIVEDGAKIHKTADSEFIIKTTPNDWSIAR